LPQSLRLQETTFEQLGDDVRAGGVIVRHG
jgi:hypothetical protein